MKRGPKPKPIADRFWPKVQKGDICWLWTGGTSGRYGSFRINGTSQTAHHVAHELMVGSVPPGFHVDHLCRNTLCVNPDHLEAVPPAINLRRGTGTKLTDAEREEIKRSTAPHSVLAERFGVYATTILRVRKPYRHAQVERFMRESE